MRVWWVSFDLSTPLPVPAGCIFMANRAFLPAVLLWATMTPALYKFARYCDIRYGSAVRQMPLETAAAAPKAKVDPALYLAPALRCE